MVGAGVTCRIGAASPAFTMVSMKPSARSRALVAGGDDGAGWKPWGEAGAPPPAGPRDKVRSRPPCRSAGKIQGLHHRDPRELAAGRGGVEGRSDRKRRGGGEHRANQFLAHGLGIAGEAEQDLIAPTASRSATICTVEANIMCEGRDDRCDQPRPRRGETTGQHVGDVAEFVDGGVRDLLAQLRGDAKPGWFITRLTVMVETPTHATSERVM